MPDMQGHLTPEDHQKLAKWWAGRWKEPVICPVCKSNTWAVASHVLNINRFAMDALADGGATYPHVLVGCITCGHSLFFNAVMMGVSVPYPPEKPTAPLAATTDDRK